MNEKENFLKDFINDYGYVLSILLLLFSVIIPLIIWCALFFKFEKGAEDSWSIGVGLFGSLVGGLCTLIAFLVSNYQTKKIQKQNIETTKKIQEENIETTLRIQEENVRLINNQLKLTILNNRINDYKNIKLRFFEIRDIIKKMEFMNLDNIFTNMQSEVNDVKKRIYNLNIEILGIDNEQTLNWFQTVLKDLSDAIELISGSSYFGDVSPAEIRKKAEESFRKEIAKFLSSANDTDLLIDTDIIQTYTEIKNLITRKS